MSDVLYIDPDGDKLRGSVDPDGNFTLRLESGMRSLLLKVMKGDARGVASRMLDRADPVTGPLFADPAIACQEDVGPSPDGEYHPCTAISRYVVERSDGDHLFGWDGKHESCEAHLAEVVTGMVNGDDRVRAVVTIRWTAQ